MFSQFRISGAKWQFALEIVVQLSEAIHQINDRCLRHQRGFRLGDEPAHHSYQSLEETDKTAGFSSASHFLNLRNPYLPDALPSFQCLIASRCSG